eukprot:TRINITY_DN15228_c0_g1_i2.p3 TRINITY_DN15228_c0_g1~~TRINITY_DN15228_c0_g1_i2.p3  ORF type:complete len:121 (-),score=21.16 TRINITY_DN15228_c0_g1_i2:454-816(-)
MGVDLGTAIVVAGVLLTWSVNNIVKTPLLSLRLPDNGIRVLSTGGMLLSPGEVLRRRQGRRVLELENHDGDGDDTDVQDLPEAPLSISSFAPVKRAAKPGAKHKLPIGKRSVANPFCGHG